MSRAKNIYILFIFIVATLVILGLNTHIANNAINGFRKLFASESTSSYEKGLSYAPIQRWDNTGTVDWAGYESEMQIMEDAGITWVRVSLSGSNTLNDEQYSRLIAHNIKPLPVLWAPKRTNGMPDYYLEPDNPARQDYKNKLKAQITKYSAPPYDIKYYEVHNEPNLSLYWNIDGGSTSNQAEYELSVRRYIEFLKDSYETIKSVDPSIKVMNGGFSEYRAERYMDAFIKYQGYKYIDIFAYHPYRDSMTGVRNRLDAMKNRMNTVSEFASKPIWITEIGFHTNPDGNSGMRIEADPINGLTAEQNRAKTIKETMEMLRTYPGVQTPIFYYSLVEEGNNGGTQPNFGLITKSKTQPYTTTYFDAYYAYRDLWRVNVTPTSSPISGISYYVDCNTGNDLINDGKSEAKAWKSISKANSATLKPGEKLLLKKGCTFTDTLTAKWTGTQALPITIGAYGSGEKPLIQINANGQKPGKSAVNITGNYQVIENIRATLINPYREERCTDQFGQNTGYGFYIGFSISGDHNTVRNSEAFGALSGGISLTDGAQYTKALNNYIHDLTSLWQLWRNDTDESLKDDYYRTTPIGKNVLHPGGPIGAIGINLHGDDGEYAYNLFEDNKGVCKLSVLTQDTAIYSAPFEVFHANRNYVHNNKAFNHKKHFEMGRWAPNPDSPTTSDNILAYNLFVSNEPSAKGPNIHNADQFGPVTGTKVLNNTIVFTGPNSEAIVASGPNTVVKNNIFIADGRTKDNTPTGINDFKVAYGCNPTVTFSNNIYWRIGGGAKVQLWRPATNDCPNTNTFADTTSRIQDPQFVDLANKNYNLKSTSYAINTGAVHAYTLDIADMKVPDPISNKIDIGAYEFNSVPAALQTPTPPPQNTTIPTSIPSPTPTVTPTNIPSPTRTPTLTPSVTPTHSPIPTPTTANNPPAVSFIVPNNPQWFTLPKWLTLQASATDTDGTIQKVEFYKNNVLIGTDTTAPYEHTAQYTIAENTYFKAKAYDNTNTSSETLALVHFQNPSSTPIQNPSPTITTSCLRSQGDADCNGIIDTLDFGCWRAELLGNKSPNCQSADFNEDGSVNVMDFSIWKSEYIKTFQVNP